MTAAACPTRCCLTSKAGAFLSSQGVAVSLVNHRLRLAVSPPPPIHLDQAQAVHSFLIQQQALRRINNAAALLEYTPEALCLDVGSQLRPLLACLQELGLSQEQTTAVFRALRRHRHQAAEFLSLHPHELRRRHFWLIRQHLSLEGPAAAAYLAAQPSLLLAEPSEAAAVVAWLRSCASWRRLALCRNLAAYPAILLAPVQQLEEAAQYLQYSLDASVEELCLLLALAPRLLAMQPQQLADAVGQQPVAWRLAAHHMDRRPMMMREAAEAQHMQVASLFLMHRHGLSRQQVADLARDNPTLLRGLVLK
ncbi:hypothetical protein D9Q98_002918 [Chlorella vulgaris]|uniref:Uncharacterized protein n=1 Tax=Chlorella vulgaris TaxID=3077 RepID=A0A9D4TUN6_CHLVU|nr:hypothetical protein D9Q98_002918 [Chlorella vulgaris]